PAATAMVGRSRSLRPRSSSDGRAVPSLSELTSLARPARNGPSPAGPVEAKQPGIAEPAAEAALPRQSFEAGQRGRALRRPVQGHGQQELAVVRSRAEAVAREFPPERRFGEASIGTRIAFDHPL